MAYHVEHLVNKIERWNVFSIKYKKDKLPGLGRKAVLILENLMVSVDQWKTRTSHLHLVMIEMTKM